MAYFPLFVEIEKKPCVVVGAGAVAERKVGQLLEFQAAVTVVAPEVTAQITAWERAGRIQVKHRAFCEEDLAGAWLVIAATDQPKLHERIAALCRAERILLNVVDVKELCTFFFPAMIKRDEVVVAVSTGGTSPALAAKLKRELEDSVPEAYGKAALALGKYRDYVMERVADGKERKQIFLVLSERAALGETLTEDVVDTVIAETAGLGAMG